jgi:hypothetical protein
MASVSSENIQKLRGLAAQLRGYAAETDLAMYQRKFESVASELEEAAVDGESRAQSRQKTKLVS